MCRQWSQFQTICQRMVPRRSGRASGLLLFGFIVTFGSTAIGAAITMAK
jgi:hypothetical protein